MGGGVPENLGNASLVVTQRPVSLIGSKFVDGKIIVKSNELAIANLANSENLTLSGTGSISGSSPGQSHLINLLSLSISNGTGPNAGQVSNYTLVGGRHLMRILHRLTFVQRVRNIMKAGLSGKSVIRTPSRTTHRRVPAVAERISISTPDQSISVSPCMLKSGYCN